MPQVRAAEAASKSESLEEAGKQRDAALAKAAELKVELDEARTSLAEKNALITRIRSESELGVWPRSVAGHGPC